MESSPLPGLQIRRGIEPTRERSTSLTLSTEVDSFTKATSTTELEPISFYLDEEKIWEMDGRPRGAELPTISISWSSSCEFATQTRLSFSRSFELTCLGPLLLSGSPGTINEVNIDTLHFKGNFPSGVEIHAINSEEVRFLY